MFYPERTVGPTSSYGAPPPHVGFKIVLKKKRLPYFAAHQIQSEPAWARSCRWSPSCPGRRCGRCSASPWCTSTRRRTRWSSPRLCSPGRTWLQRDRDGGGKKKKKIRKNVKKKTKKWPSNRSQCNQSTGLWLAEYWTVDGWYSRKGCARN